MSVAETKFEPATVNVRTKISALWTSMLFVFAYVDLFSLYRPDFRADLEAAEVGGFTVNQSFLLGTTAYVVIPSLMVFSTLVLQPRLNRVANIALGIVYIVTIVIGAVGEWSYYILGSVVEVAMLAAIVYYAWTWPKQHPPPPDPDESATTPEVIAQHTHHNASRPQLDLRDSVISSAQIDQEVRAAWQTWRLRRGSSADLEIDVLNVVLDGTPGEHKPFGDLCVGRAT